jgi:hypothetical protein
MNVESTPWISCSAFSDWTGWIRVKRIPVGFGLFLAGMGHEIHKCIGERRVCLGELCILRYPVPDYPFFNFLTSSRRADYSL